MLRRFFPASRRSREAAVGLVGLRWSRNRTSAARSFSTSRSTASSRFRAWLRSSWATARSTGPDPPDDPPLLHVRERRRRFDVEDRLDPRGRLLRVLASRPARPGDPQPDLRNRQRDGARDANIVTLHGLHSARRRRRAPRLWTGDPRGCGSDRRAAPRRPSAPLRHEQLDEAARASRRGDARDGLRARQRRATDDPRSGRAGARRQACARARHGRGRPGPRPARARRARRRSRAHRGRATRRSSRTRSSAT